MDVPIGMSVIEVELVQNIASIDTDINNVQKYTFYW